MGDDGKSSAGEGHDDGGASGERGRRRAVLATLAGETTSDDGGAIFSQGRGRPGVGNDSVSSAGGAHGDDGGAILPQGRG